jgi:replicative DNA helicase
MTYRKPDVEKSLLAHILSNKYVPENVHAGMFTGEERALFDDILFMWGMNGDVDPVALSKRFKAVIVECLAQGGSASDIVINAANEAHIKRTAAQAILSGVSDDDPIGSIRNLHSDITNLLISNKNSDYNHAQSLGICMDLISQGCIGTSMLGIPIGVSEFDEVLHGFEKKKTYIIGALKKTGKSRFMVYIAIKLAQSGARLLINSLEMSDVQLNMLAIAYLAKIDSSVLGNMEISKSKLECIKSATSDIIAFDWKINRDYTMPDLRARIMGMKRKNGCDYVFIDFLQRMRDDRYKKDRVREVERLSIDMADISRDCDVGIICLAQLSGEAEKCKGLEMPNMSNLKESQGIAENADAIIIIHNPERHSETRSSTVPMRAKIEQRYGLSGPVIDMQADLRYCDFVQSDAKYVPSDEGDVPARKKDWGGNY